MLLIITIICLQHFSGLIFTKRFLLQILAPAKKFDGEVNSETPNDTEENNAAYYFAILINGIRMAANLMMSNFLKRYKVEKYQINISKQNLATRILLANTYFFYFMCQQFLCLTYARSKKLSAPNLQRFLTLHIYISLAGSVFASSSASASSPQPSALLSLDAFFPSAPFMKLSASQMTRYRVSQSSPSTSLPSSLD